MSLAILIHSSKTMRSPDSLNDESLSNRAAQPATTPELIDLVKPLAAHMRTMTAPQLQKMMQISAPLSQKVHDAFMAWNAEPQHQSLAIDSFIGDIYSGLRANTLSEADRDYAQQTLRILSGLYGVLRPYDGVRPYRLEMGYTFRFKSHANLYTYWGMSIADTLPKQGLIINLSAAEYTKTVLPHVDTDRVRVIAPRFLTVNPKTGQPGQVIVHTKIARGAFARWLVTSRVDSAEDMIGFNDLNYEYVAALSTPSEPTFVCKTFGGIGLSMRLQKNT